MKLIATMTAMLSVLAPAAALSAEEEKVKISLATRPQSSASAG